LASYLDVNLITFVHPTKLSTMHTTLKCECNMITTMWWTYSASKDLKKSKKRFDHFYNLKSHILMQKQDFYLKRVRNFKQATIATTQLPCSQSRWQLLSKHLTTIGPWIDSAHMLKQ
jgi:hypothetical protein